MKHRIPIFGLILFVVLFIYLQLTSAYHFFFMEQGQLFLFTVPYLLDTVTQPGGPALYLGEFLAQFFIVPYAGAGLTALLLAGAGVLTASACRRIAPNASLYLFWALPSVTLLFIHFNFNYILQGTVAYLFALIAWNVYIRIKGSNRRIVYGLVAVPLLFWLGGSIAVLFAVCSWLWEILTRSRQSYGGALLVAETILVGYLLVDSAIMGEYRFAFLPDLFFNPGLPAPAEIYFSWVALPVIIFITGLFRHRKKVSLKIERAATIVQIACIIGLAWVGAEKYNDKNALFFRELDYYTRTGQWDAIIEKCSGKLTNYLYVAHLNMALAEKGILADKMFAFNQAGIEGLLISWNQTSTTSSLLSDIYFTIGNIALSQQMAFESYISNTGYGNPRMLKRLVQTNLIYGYYPVAEKYINLLEKTFFYKKWANEHRRFLYDDEAVNADPVLGVKRCFLPDKNFLSYPSVAAGLDMQVLAGQCPQNRTPMEYLGAAFLLSKDMNAFRTMIETYYGTELLPVLPVSFQEAVIIYSESNPEAWETYHISPAVIKRFQSYRQQVIATRNSGNPANLLRNSFGDTFWFYYMFKK